MAELSNLLGAVYGDTVENGRDPDGPPTPVEPAAADRGPAVPDWADDAHLDAAFAAWTPGPAAHAHAVERAIVTDEPVVAQPLADDLAAALSEALVASDAHEDQHALAADERHGAVADDDAEDDDEPEAPDADALPFERRRAAVAELSATAGPLPLAPPPPTDVAEEAHEDEPVAAVASASPSPALQRTWARSDDDILPAKRRGFLSLRRG